ncbi:ABC transporter ATP-binding protein [Desulfovibrio inopinatus]|uniref:ABC transporter ATP-binding protein n=1 Tax=Desulfovibrio inopinatus TaxID=102109 RepID=UPI000424D763|nr:ABC transporter ATP-binding protein [Desulfovibrio inopinatus]
MAAPRPTTEAHRVATPDENIAPLLRVRSMSKFFGERLILKNIHVDVVPQSITLLAGANGAGKTTLLRIMAGLIPPSTGSVQSDLLPGDLAYLGHKTFVYRDLSARHNLVFWLRLHGREVDADEVDAALKQVGLFDYADEYARVFSRGMMQKLSLARVYMLKPRLLFLDEPDTGLDVASRQALLWEMEILRDAGTAIVFVSHHVDTDIAVADTALALSNKSIVYHGPAASYDAAAVLDMASC